MMDDIWPIQEFGFNNTVQFDRIHKIMAIVVDIKNETIVKAVIDTARSEGIDDLIVLDKEFVLRAIRNELERFMNGV